MSGHTLLVVDADEVLYGLVAAELRAAGWQIDVAHNSDEALACVRTRRYEMVLTDIHGPNLDGLELLAGIRKVRPDAKVMVMTAGSTPADVVRAIRQQAFCYVSKPVSAAALVELIVHAVDVSQWEDDIEVLSAAPNWISMKLRCKIQTADRLVQFVREMEMDLPVRERENIAAAFRELVLNAMEHGCESDPEKRVQVTYVRTARAIVYLIQDPGKGFSFDKIEHAAVANPPGDPARHLEIRAERGVRPGGFGILLTRNLVDELIYNETGNEVLIIKYLK